MNTREGGLSFGELGGEDGTTGSEVEPDLELEHSKDEKSIMTVEEAVGFINELAQNGQTETLLDIKSNFIEFKVCTEDEFDELFILALTKRARRYMDIAQEIKSQAEEINRALGSDYVNLDLNQKVVKSYYKKAADFDLERARVIYEQERRHDARVSQLLEDSGNGSDFSPEE